MTNRMKTVRYPRVILLACRNAARLAAVISDALNYCSYNTCIDDFSENTDFVIVSGSSDELCPENSISDTVLYDETTEVSPERIGQFRKKVTSYENALHHSTDSEGVITYSDESYGADVECRNVSSDGKRIAFDVIGKGILARADVDGSRYTVSQVLACTGVLMACGLPIASVIGFFSAG